MEIFKMLLVFIIYALLLGGVAVIVIRMIGGGVYPSQQRGAITVIDRMMIAPNKGLLLIKVAGKVLLIGVSDNDFKILSEFKPEEISLREEPSAPSFESFLKKVIPGLSKEDIKGNHREKGELEGRGK